MKMLFIARHYTYFRNYDSALRELSARGHQIQLAVEKDDGLGGRAAVEALAAENAGITFGELPDRGDDPWAGVSRRLRLGLDYLRYLDPFYDDAPLRRMRAWERTPQALIALAEPPLVGGQRWRRRLGRWLHALDLAIPPPQVVVDFIRAQRPDVVLITPLVDLGSQQIDFLRAARLLNIPTALAVWSWDHLSSKAYIRECPERVFVWNATQRREAIEVHGVPADRVVVTGAQCFDHWFERTPTRTRDEFCRQLGLPADRPLILYVCTGLIMGSPPEPPFVREWLQRLRASSDPRVATAGVLVRPHPAQAYTWNDVDVSDFGPVAVWGGNPVDDRSRRDYFDSLYHSAAVVGLNTSAFIEAGIVGREVLAILPPQYHDNQEGTVHFKYLLEIGGGLLRVSRDFDRHVAQLSDALGRPVSPEHPHRAFLESFVRPFGLTTPATPTFVEHVERLRECRVHPADVPAAAPVRRTLAGAVARLSQMALAQRLVMAPREAQSLARMQAASAVKEERRQATAVMRRERLERRRLRDAELEARRQARVQEEGAVKQARARARLQRLENKTREAAEAVKHKVAQRADAQRQKKRAERRRRLEKLLRTITGRAA